MADTVAVHWTCEFGSAHRAGLLSGTESCESFESPNCQATHVWIGLLLDDGC